MCNDAYRDMTHKEMAVYLQTFLGTLGQLAVREFVLSNGRIADIYATGTLGSLIIEVKTEYRDSYLRDIIKKYANHADRLILAIPEGRAPRQIYRSPLDWLDTSVDLVGIIEVAWDGVRMIRAATVRQKQVGHRD